MNYLYKNSEKDLYRIRQSKLMYHDHGQIGVGLVQVNNLGCLEPGVNKQEPRLHANKRQTEWTR